MSVESFDPNGNALRIEASDRMNNLKAGINFRVAT
jgi:hypothetical protein